MISPLSWAPIAVAVFGIGNEPVIFLIAVAAVWPVLINTVAGVRCRPGLPGCGAVVPRHAVKSS